jgi:hypothetical protein
LKEVFRRTTATVSQILEKRPYNGTKTKKPWQQIAAMAFFIYGSDKKKKTPP